MIPRLVVYIPVAAVVVFLLFRLEDRGRMTSVNRTYVEWLVANSRGGFVAPDADQVEDKVVLLALSDPQARVFERWPPDPLDYALLLTKLAEFDPSVVAIHPLLDFDDPGDLALRSINRAALALPSIVLGVPLLFDPAEEFVDPVIRSVLKPLNRVGGDTGRAIAFTGLLGLPHERMRLQRYLAFNQIYNVVSGTTGFEDEPGRANLVARMGGDLYPSLALETVLLHERTPLATTRFRLGQGAGVFIRDDRFIPLNPDGTLDIADNADALVLKVDAAELLTAGSGVDDLSSEGWILDEIRGSIAVLGLDDPESRIVELSDGSLISPAELTARTIASIMAMPKIDRLGTPWVIGIAAVAFVASLFLLRCKPGRVLMFGVILLFANFVLGFLFFQALASWWPPVMPMAILLLAVLVGVLVPLRRERVAPAGAHDGSDQGDDHEEEAGPPSTRKPAASDD